MIASIPELLNDHVPLEIDSIDRLYLNGYQPHLQYAGAIVSFFRYHRGKWFLSP